MMAVVMSAVCCRRRPPISLQLPMRQASNNKKWTIDKSKVPVIKEADLEENFISGWGPGGQNVNKAINCCQLRHNPSGIIVKVHQSRSLDQNRKLARELIQEKLDDMINGENSVSAQKKRVALMKASIRESGNEKRRAMKEDFRKRFGSESSSSSPAPPLPPLSDA